MTRLHLHAASTIVAMVLALVSSDWELLMCPRDQD